LSVLGFLLLGTFRGQTRLEAAAFFKTHPRGKNDFLVLENQKITVREKKGQGLGYLIKKRSDLWFHFTNTIAGP
jgi:hypothetical protein